MKKIELLLIILIISFINIPTFSNPDSLQTRYTPYLNPKYNFGIELNPGLLLYTKDENATVISAGFSIFPKHRKTELAIPIVLEYSKDDHWFGGNYSGKSVNLDFHYRLYLTGKIGGFYTSLGAKYNYAFLISEDLYQPSEKYTINRLGFGFGVGYRIFSDDRLFWGIGIFVGRYFGKDISKKVYISSIFTDEDYSFINIQLLKIGYAF